MKKQLLWCLALLLTGLTSCTKDSFKPADQASVGSKDKLRVAVANPGTVTELTLLPRQPGENFDTYAGNWGGVNIKMQATPFWNHDLYPNLVNGVPCTGGGYSVGDQNQISTSNAGGQDIFIVGVATASFTAQQLFNADVTTYINALDSYISSHTPSSAIPQASSYIKISYSDGNPDPHFVQVSGKLIRITTGSHFAFASIDYPTPAPVVQTTKIISFVKDNIEYAVNVYGSTITGVSFVQYQTPPFAKIPASGASGTCTATGGQNYDLNVTVNLTDGSSVHYQGAALLGI